MKKTINVENVICSSDTMSRHPDIYHYTNQAAFEGILGSQTLWCSHFREMLDANEVRLMRDLLPPAVAPQMDAIAEKFNRNKRRVWRRAGGGIETARSLVNSLYGATFDGEAVYSALDVFLFSFSTHADDTAFDREHGVRSQWDEYAGPEGYCLVFDICGVARLLDLEMGARYWAKLTLAPVRYADRPVEDIFPELVDASTDTLRQFVDGVRSPAMAVPEFLAGTTLLKGAAYKSERELRIVGIPGSPTMAQHAAMEHPDEFDVAAPLPAIRARSETGRRYIALFDGLGLRLPIKRVIVGPGTQQEKRAELVRSMLDGVSVTMSCCP
jgi:hypothetical protein